MTLPVIPPFVRLRASQQRDEEIAKCRARITELEDASERGLLDALEWVHFRPGNLAWNGMQAWAIVEMGRACRGNPFLITHVRLRLSEAGQWFLIVGNEDISEPPLGPVSIEEYARIVDVLTPPRPCTNGHTHPMAKPHEQSRP